MRHLSLLLLIAALPAIAQDDLPATIAGCRAIEDDARRLACYDRAAARLATGTKAAAVDPPPPAPTPARTTPPPRTPEPDNPRGPQPEPEELKARVVNIESRPRGELVITLDNGQTWEELSPSTYFPLEPGDTVELKTGFFGSWRLVSPAGRATRVRRTEQP